MIEKYILISTTSALGGVIAKIVFDWLRPKKNNGSYMPSECRQKMEALTLVNHESVLLLRDIKDILKENQNVLIQIRTNRNGKTK